MFYSTPRGPILPINKLIHSIRGKYLYSEIKLNRYINYCVHYRMNRQICNIYYWDLLGRIDEDFRSPVTRTGAITEFTLVEMYIEQVRSRCLQKRTITHLNILDHYCFGRYPQLIRKKRAYSNFMNLLLPPKL